MHRGLSWPWCAVPARRRAVCSDVQRGLLLRGGKRPCGPCAALVAKDESQLRRRLELGLRGAIGGARLIQLERAKQVDPEEALIAADLRRGPSGRTPVLHALRLHLPPSESRTE